MMDVKRATTDGHRHVRLHRPLRLPDARARRSFAPSPSTTLQYIPMPVLYGVFLYMGISALDGIQLVDR